MTLFSVTHICTLSMSLGLGDRILCHPIYTEKMKPKSTSLSKSQIMEEHGWLVECQELS